MLSILLFAGLACSLVSNTRQKVENAQSTARHFATQVQEGREVVSTVQGLATQVGGSSLAATLRSVATDVDEGGYLETVQALATERGPSLMATAKAFATQEGPDLIMTAKAYATQFASSSNEAPTDIPLLEGERLSYYANSNLVSYVSSTPFQAALNFYQDQMTRQGWIRTDNGSTVTSNVAVLTFTKEGRQATVSLSVNPLSDSTIVLITIN